MSRGRRGDASPERPGSRASEGIDAWGRWRAGLAASSVIVMACSGRSAPPVAGARLGLALTAALTAADGAREAWRCGAAAGPGLADETLTVGARTWRLAGHAMTLAAAGGGATSGRIADAGGSAPVTLAEAGGGATSVGIADGGGNAAATPAQGGGVTIGVIADAGGSAPATPAQGGGVTIGVVADAGGSAPATPAQGGGVTIGVIADAGGNAPATLAALARLRVQLARADLVIALGGMGQTRAELDAVLGALVDGAPGPLVALPGDLESAGALAEAVVAARARGAPVIDGRLVQRIEWPGVTIAVVAGASAVGRLAAGVEGCVYRADDVAAALVELARRPGLRIVASAEAPRSTADDAASGELALVGASIDLALHGPTKDGATAARSGNRDGAAVSLSPGSSDAMPRLPGARRLPAAGVLTVRGDSWRWQPIADVK